MSSKNTVYFRADGDGTIGYGHVIRSLALADMLKDEYRVVFIAKESTRLLESEISKSCEEIIWIPNHITLTEESAFLTPLVQDHAIAVRDGYSFDTHYQQQFKNIFYKLVCIDDLHAFPFVADAVINQSGKVSESDYTLAANTKLYSGLKYLLLRKPFLDAAKDKRALNMLSKVFVCFGGADPDNLAGKAIEASLLVPSVEEIHVVVSKNFKAEYLQKLQEKSKKSIVMHSQLSAEEMCALMKKCDVAIAPSSSISFELCSVGIALISGYFVDNQKDIFYYGKDKGFFISAGDFRVLSSLQLSELFPSLEHAQQVFLKQQEYFNGQSSTNFKVLFQELFSKK